MILQSGNEYLLVKGLLNKFDYTVSAGYENAELACDIREKRLKKEVESFSGRKRFTACSTVHERAYG